jgi:hypothetical protein
MESLDYWRLNEELSIVHAALLLAECDPSTEKGYVEDWKMHERPHGYEAAKTAIYNAFRRGTIKGTVVPEYDYNINGTAYPVADTVSMNSIVDVESLREWLATRGIRTGFFFPTATDAPDYLDPKNPRYAPKLAAAVRAWQSVTDAGGKHPKQALAKWLREHAAEFGMTDDEGKPNETGIEEAAKVANWQPGGGAPKTPGE